MHKNGQKTIIKFDDTKIKICKSDHCNRKYRY